MNSPHSIEQLLPNNLTDSVTSGAPPALNKSISLGEEDNVEVRDLVMNSLQLSKRLHSEMVSKEFDLKNHVNQTNAKLKGMFNEMEEIYRKNQRLYEEVVHQNQKTRFLAEELIRPFRDELKNKVDEKTLSIKMRTMMAEYDSIGHNITYDMTDRQHGGESSAPVFAFIREEMMPVLADLEDRMRKMQEEKVSAGLGEEERSKLAEQVEQIKRVIKQQLDQGQNSNKQVVDQLSSRLISSEKTIASLTDRLKGNDRQLRNQSNKLNQTAKNIQGSISQKHLSAQLLMIRKQIQQVSDDQCRNLTQQLKLLQQRSQTVEERLLTKVRDNERRIKEVEGRVNSELQSIRKHTDGLIQQVKTLLQEDTSSPSRNFAKRISNLQACISGINDEQKRTDAEIDRVEGQYQALKAVLAQKANFSDVLKQVESKADKADYRDLKIMILSSRERRDRTPEIIEPMNSTQMSSRKTGHSKRRSLSNSKMRQNFVIKPKVAHMHLHEQQIEETPKGKFTLGLSPSPTQNKEYLSIDRNRHRLMLTTGVNMKETISEPFA